MDEDHVNEWVQKKLDRGISEERIKKTLEKSGRDPSIVDRVKSGQAVPEEAETGDEAGSDDDPFDSLKYVDNEEEKDTGEKHTEEGGDSSGLPSVNLPSMPSFSLPATDINAQKFFPVLAVLLLAGLGYTGMTIMDGGSAVNNALQSCEGTDIEIRSVGESGSETIAEVSTSQQTELVLEIYSGEEKMGETTETIDGRGLIRLGAAGDRAVLYESGCRDSSVEQSY